MGNVQDAAKRGQTQVTVERRLYDVGSILCSANLIKKTYLGRRRCSRPPLPSTKAHCRNTYEMHCNSHQSLRTAHDPPSILGLIINVALTCRSAMALRLS